MLLWMSSPSFGGDEVGLDGLVDLAGDGTFENAHGVFLGFAGGDESVAVELGAWVVAESAHRDSVGRAVGVAVAATVEAVAIRFAR